MTEREKKWHMSIKLDFILWKCVEALWKLLIIIAYSKQWILGKIRLFMKRLNWLAHFWRRSKAMANDFFLLLSFHQDTYISRREAQPPKLFTIYTCILCIYILFIWTRKATSHFVWLFVFKEHCFYYRLIHFWSFSSSTFLYYCCCCCCCAVTAVLFFLLCTDAFYSISFSLLQEILRNGNWKM